MCIINGDSEGKYPREVKMVNRVAAVKAAIASKTPLSLFDNPQMKEYLCKLNPKHSPPYHLEQTPILEVMIDAAMKELDQMLTECREHLHEGFVLGMIIFWTDSYSREQYGLFVIDFSAQKYELEDGTSLFMSKKTKEGLPNGILLTGKSNNANFHMWLEYI
jgi:hypothetical protein